MSTLNETAELLRLYFIQQGELILSGVGRFTLRRTPAVFNEASGILSAPGYKIDFTPGTSTSTKDLIVYISKKKNISEPEAIALLNDFNKEVNTRIQAGEAVQWTGIGSLFLKNQEIECLPDLIDLTFQKDIQTLPSLSNETLPVEEGVILDEDLVVTLEEDNQPKSKNVFLILLALLATLLIALVWIQQHGVISYRTGAISPTSTPQQFQSNTAE